MKDHDLQLPHLATFTLATELGSFTQAAAALGLTQAAVSQRIAALEQVLGKSLFRRSGGQAIPSEAGLKLYEYAQRIQELHRQALREIAERETPLSGELSLATSSIPGEYLLPELLDDFGKKHPHVRARASVGDSLAVVEHVKAGHASLGLLGCQFPDRQLEFQPLARDRMVLVVGQNHALGRRKSTTLDQLSTLPLIWREAGSGLRRSFEKALEAVGRSPQKLNVALELGSNEAIKEAVHRGLGVGLLSELAVRKEVASGRLRRLGIRGLRCERELYVVRDLRRVVPPAARLFLLHLAAHPCR